MFRYIQYNNDDDHDYVYVLHELAINYKHCNTLDNACSLSVPNAQRFLSAGLNPTSDGKMHPPPGDLCRQHREFKLRLSHRSWSVCVKSLERRNVYYSYYACKECFKTSTGGVSNRGASEIELSAIHINIMGLKVLNN